MVEKVAVPFWLCWSAGMLISLFVGHPAEWLVGSAVVGIVIGLLLRARVMRARRSARASVSAPEWVSVSGEAKPTAMDEAA